jgi:hypothetical protein
MERWTGGHVGISLASMQVLRISPICIEFQFQSTKLNVDIGLEYWIHRDTAMAIAGRGVRTSPHQTECPGIVNLPLSRLEKERYRDASLNMSVPRTGYSDGKILSAEAPLLG